MKKKKLSRLLIVLFSFFLLSGYLRVSATDVDDKGPVIVGRRTSDDAVYVYIDGAAGAQNVTVQIGSENCDNVKWSHGIFRKRTLLLLDNSLSMSQHWKDQSLSLMKLLIDDHAPEEEFMVATYSTEVNKLSSYSNDYDSLRSIVAGISFANQKSYLTDALYQLLQEVMEDKDGTFYRFVIIADGANDNTITYTEEELKELIRKAGVPLYSVGVNTGGNAAQLQTLFSWSRLSAVEPVLVEKKTDPSTVTPALHTDPLCVCIVPERSIQDGGTREAKITVDGVVLTTTLTLPFASEWNGNGSGGGDGGKATPTPAPATPTPAPTPEEKEEPAEEDGDDEEEEDDRDSARDDRDERDDRDDRDEDRDYDEEDEDEDDVDSILMVVLIAGISLVAILAVIVIILAVKHRKNGDDFSYADDGEMNNPPDYIPEDLGRTERNVDGSVPAVVPPSTRELWKNYIRLTDSRDPSRCFTLPIKDRIEIGRKAPADLILDFDKAVSARHCMITFFEGRYYLTDLGSSNHTYYEGMMVTGDVPLRNGGRIRIGHGEYIFEAG